MPSTFFGLNIAYSGLLASNAWQNTTANNIANVQTEGYSRQQVVQQAADALRVFQTYGCAGAGVETLAVERIRDEFYDYRFWNNNAKLGEYDMKQYYMQQIEAYFDDNGANAGFKTVFDQMMITGIEAWMNNSNDTSTKNQFVGYAETLAEYFNNVSGNLQKLQADVNQEIKLKVDEINSIAGEIATLNKQINTIELTGINANELRDRRALLIDQLSEIVDVSVSETPIVDSNNPDRVTGANRYMVKIAGGQILVDGSEYNGLECIARKDSEKVNQSDIDGLYDVYWTGTNQKFNLYSGAMGGDLKGLIDIRDGNNSEYFNGTVPTGGISQINDAQGNATGSYAVTVEVSAQYLIDLNKCNLSDQGGIINLNNREFNYDSWTYNISFDTNGDPVYSYTFVLSPDNDKNANLAADLADKMNVKASSGASISYQGVPYYMSQMNEWVRTFSQKINDILTSGYSGDQAGCQLFVADWATGDKQYEFPDGTDPGTADSRYDLFLADIMAQVEAEKKRLLDSGAAANEAAALAQAKINITAGQSFSLGVREDSYFQMTALNMNILNALLNDPSKLANKYSQSDGVEQNDLIEDIRDLATDKEKMTFRGSSASEFLQCILSDVTLNTSRAESFYQSFKDVSYSIDTQRASISGVDEDEEAVNLVKYQFSYNLACKMIQTLTEMYDRLILSTGV